MVVNRQNPRRAFGRCSRIAYNRTFDEFRRAQETEVVVTNVRHSAKIRLYDSEDRVCGYALTNAAGRGVSVSLAYDGSYVTNTIYTMSNGSVFSAKLSREAGRRNLVTRRDYFFGGQSVYWYSTEYDLLNRPTNATDSVSLAREWLYNRRSELAAASVGTNLYGYAYDTIGNRLWSAANAVTNSYSANSLNQYASTGSGTNFVYDSDGNMTSDGAFSYSYDAENRLLAAYPLSPAVGSLAVENRYDHRHRRSRKVVKQYDGADWETKETHTFVWDGNNIVLERVESANGTTRTFEYFWGADKSGSEQGAGGVGGLLAVSVDGVFYIPCYDHNGNIIVYVSETGSIAAQHTYDPYGNVIDTYGSLADVFYFGFSTQYHDRETGMIGYKRRFYRPDLGRWLNRDPIEENGGENLYGFCDNNPVLYIDILGESFWGYFSDGVRMLAGTLSFIAGAKLTFATGGVGGVLGGAALMAYGLDQIHNAYENMKSRYQGRALPPGTFIQQSYREMSYRLTGYHGSTLETALDYSYTTFEVIAACATGWASVTRSAAVIRQVKPLQTVGRWTATETSVRMIRYEFVIEGGVSGSTAAGVVVVETFNVSINVIGILPSPEIDTDTNPDIPIPNDFTGPAR